MPIWEEVYQLLSSAGDHLVWPVIGAAIDGLLAAVNSKWLQRVLERYTNIAKKTWKIPRSVYIIIFGTFLLIALALAWLDQYRTIHTLGTEKKAFTATIKVKEERIEDLKAKNESLVARLFQVQTPQNSPRLQIYLGDKLVNGAIFKVDVNKDGIFTKNGIFTLPVLSIKNVGKADAQNFRSRMYFSYKVEDPGYCWMDLKTPDGGYLTQFYFPGPGCGLPPAIGVGERWSGTTPITGRIVGNIPVKINARVVIYYSGQESPTIADFIILPQQKS